MQIVFSTRRKTEEHLLIVMDKSTHEELLSQPVQNNNKQFKVAFIFLLGYKVISDVTISNSKFYFPDINNL